MSSFDARLCGLAAIAGIFIGAAIYANESNLTTIGAVLLAIIGLVSAGAMVALFNSELFRWVRIAPLAVALALITLVLTGVFGRVVAVDPSAAFRAEQQAAKQVYTSQATIINCEATSGST